MTTPHHSTLAAYAALAIAVAGGSTATAAALKRNSVGSAQIRNGAVQRTDLARDAKPPTRARMAQVVTDVVSDPASNLNITVHGEKGDKGDTGNNGLNGNDGNAGPTGAQGVQGEAGPKGAQGAQGTAGRDGTSVGAGNVQPNGDAELTYLTLTAHTTEGTYCFNVDHGVLPTPRAAVATPSSADVHVTVRNAPSSGACAGRDFEVTTYNATGTVTDAGFDIIVA